MLLLYMPSALSLFCKVDIFACGYSLPNFPAIEAVFVVPIPTEVLSPATSMEILGFSKNSDSQ